MPPTTAQVAMWVTELDVMASFHNSPILREIANALDEGLITGRIYIDEQTTGNKEREI